MTAMWSVADARAKFATVLASARAGEPQLIRQSGLEDVAVIRAETRVNPGTAETTVLLDGGGWFARIEKKGDSSEVQFCRVIAWERTEIAAPIEGRPPEPGLVAWLNGITPVRSDRFYPSQFSDAERPEHRSLPGHEWILNGFTQKLPERWVEFSWS